MTIDAETLPTMAVSMKDGDLHADDGKPSRKNNFKNLRKKC